jgi:thiosulfate reductase cytochrome b subunit
VLLLLAANSALSLSGFGGNRETWRTAHAYLGSLILCLLFTHALLGLKLGLSL